MGYKVKGDGSGKRVSSWEREKREIGEVRGRAK